MKALPGLLLALTLAFPCLLKTGILVWFEANRKYIEAELCENRNKPEMRCCGHCVLRKTIRKAETPIPQKLASLLDKAELTFTVAEAIRIAPKAFHNDPAPADAYLARQLAPPPGRLFRPPIVAASIA